LGIESENMLYPDFAQKLQPGDQLLFDIGYTYSLLQGAGCSWKGLDPELRGEVGEDLLAHIEASNQGCLQVRNMIYEHAEEVAKFAKSKKENEHVTVEEIRMEVAIRVLARLVPSLYEYWSKCAYGVYLCRCLL
jgi:hypothetical protein